MTPPAHPWPRARKQPQPHWPRRYAAAQTLPLHGPLTPKTPLPTPWPALLLMLVLTGCTTPPPAPPPQAAVTVAPADAEPGANRLAALPAFQARQRETAAAAAQRGNWAEALWAWDVLLALQPGDPALLEQRAQAELAAASAAADRLQRARQAQQRGDADAATRLYLEVLALAPADRDAAQGLRQLERERVKRQHLGQLSRNTLSRRNPAESVMPAASSLGTTVPSSERNEVEHASMLAAQGEIDAAIAVLKPLALARRPDSMARRLLADLHIRQAESLMPGDRVAALAALERALLADPSHTRAAALLKEWSTPATGSGTKSIPPRPTRPTSR